MRTRTLEMRRSEGEVVVNGGVGVDALEIFWKSRFGMR